MISDLEALARIERSMQHYLGRCITRGETLEEVIDALEASGRMLDGADADQTSGELRSWAPTGEAAPRARARRPAAAARPAAEHQTSA